MALHAGKAHSSCLKVTLDFTEYNSVTIAWNLFKFFRDINNGMCNAYLSCETNLVGFIWLKPFGKFNSLQSAHPRTPDRSGRLEFRRARNGSVLRCTSMCLTFLNF